MSDNMAKTYELYHGIFNINYSIFKNIDSEINT